MSYPIFDFSSVHNYLMKVPLVVINRNYDRLGLGCLLIHSKAWREIYTIELTYHPNTTLLVVYLNEFQQASLQKYFITPLATHIHQLLIIIFTEYYCYPVLRSRGVAWEIWQRLVSA